MPWIESVPQRIRLVKFAPEQFPEHGSPPVE